MKSEEEMRDMYRYSPENSPPNAPGCATVNENSKPHISIGGSERFHQLLEEIGKLHDQKQKDYGLPTDPFANVRASSEWGMDSWVGAMVRATDKVRRLQTYARTGKLSNEGVEDAFKDLAVYSLIALVLWEERNER
mgnify:CR=1 FL=1